MSADTSIAYWKFPEWRKHTDIVQAVENMNRENYDSEREWIEWVRGYNRSKPFKEKHNCMRSARRLWDLYDDDYLPLEYGIVDVWVFPFSI